LDIKGKSFVMKSYSLEMLMSELGGLTSSIIGIFAAMIAVYQEIRFNILLVAESFRIKSSRVSPNLKDGQRIIAADIQ